VLGVGRGAAHATQIVGQRLAELGRSARVAVADGIAGTRRGPAGRG
jgi:hypothetical protein